MVQETVSQGADPMGTYDRFCSAAAHQSGNRGMAVCTPDWGRQPHPDGQTEYLTKDFQGAYSPLGSIFTFAGARFSDSQVYLFAHNMASGQMFGSLKQFTNDAFLAANPEAYLYTPERVRETAGGRLEVSAGR